jgi:CheY-like chemotaxis protein
MPRPTAPRLDRVTVLLVEHEPGAPFTRLLRRPGAVVVSTRGPREALERWDRVASDLLITDAVTSDDGLRLLERALDAGVPSLGLTHAAGDGPDTEVLLARTVAALVRPGTLFGAEAAGT